MTYNPVILAGRLEEYAEACIDMPGLVGTPEFDEFVDDLRGISPDVAAAFVRRVHDGLKAAP